MPSVRPMRNKWASCFTNGHLNFSDELPALESAPAEPPLKQSEADRFSGRGCGEFPVSVSAEVEKLDSSLISPEIQ